MTGKPVYTASKERMVPVVMFSTDHAPLSAVFSPLCSITNEEQVGEAPLQSIQSP